VVEQQGIKYIRCVSSTTS